MNLHAIANSAIKAVNPNEQITIYLAQGQNNVQGIVTPLYLAPVTVTAQVQSQPDSGLLHVEGYNENKLVKNFYMTKADANTLLAPSALKRQEERTGDIIQRADGSFWLVTKVLEDFSEHIVLQAELQTEQPDFTAQEWYNANPSD